MGIARQAEGDERDKLPSRHWQVHGLTTGECGPPYAVSCQFQAFCRLRCPIRLLYRWCSRLPALVRRSEPQETDMSDHKYESGFQYSVANLKPAEAVQKITL